MELEGQNTTEPTESTASAEVTTESAAPSGLDKIKEAASKLSDDTPAGAPLGAPKAPMAAVTPEVPLPPTYSPNFKYKANGEEKELDERVRGIVKDKETEEWIKKVFAKADGIEAIQQQREHIRNEYNTLRTEAEKVLAAVDKRDYRGALESLGVNVQDIGHVMQGLGFSKQQIIEHAYNLAQLTPEQEQAHARQRELENRAQQQYSANEQLNQKLYQADVQLKTFELRSTLSTPEIAPLVEAFDKHHGQGQFWNQVCQRGEYYDLKGQTKSTQELVQEVLAFARVHSPAQVTSAPQATPAHTQQKVPVIPNVGGGNTSPTRKKISSIESMKQFAQELSD
jgi:hypothetical protein